MVTPCEQHQRRARSTFCQQVSQIFIDNSEMLRFRMVGSFPRSAWQYALVLQTFLFLFLPSCLIPALSLSPPLLGLHSHLHIFTGLFPPDFFHLASYGLQYLDFFFFLISISKIINSSYSFSI